MLLVERDVLGNSKEDSFAQQAFSPKEQIDRGFRNREAEQMLTAANVRMIRKTPISLRL
jgi:hypothetical protein